MGRYVKLGIVLQLLWRQLGQLKTVFFSSFYLNLCVQLNSKSSAIESFICGVQMVFLHDVRVKQLRSAYYKVTEHYTQLPNVVMPHYCFNLKHGYFTTVISTCFRVQYRRYSTLTRI